MILLFPNGRKGVRRISGAIALSAWLTCGVAQITVTEADMPDAGDVYLLTSAVPDLSIDLSVTGPNQVWDFSDLDVLTGYADSFISNDDLPLAYWLFFLSSNLAEKNAFSYSSDLLTLEDVYTVYKKSSDQFQIDGYAGTIDGLPVPVVYDEKDVLYRFPLDYGDADSSDAGVTVEIPGLFYFEQQRHRVNTVDGWGTIVTPVGSYEALRVRSVLTDVDSIFVDTIGSGYSITLRSYEYRWLAAGQGIPVFQINAQDVGGVPVITQILYQDTALQSLAAEPFASMELSIFPNPASDRVKIFLPAGSPSPLFIYDWQGRTCFTGTAADAMLIDVSEWPDGIYYVRCLQGDRVQVKGFLVFH